MIEFTPLHLHALDMLGYIPLFLSEDDERPAREQFDANYVHGGGWSPLKGWHLTPVTGRIVYPGDPPLDPIAVTRLRDETIYVYPHSWIAIVQKDGSYEVARMD